MVIKQNKFRQKLKNYTLVILSFIIILLLIGKSSFPNNQSNQFKLNKEKNKLSDKIIKTRKLDEYQDENTHIKNYDKFCEKASEDLNEYYTSGNIGDIEKIDDYIKYDNKDKDKKYFKSLINIINYLIYNKKEKENLLKIESIKDDVKTYIKHMVPVFIFFGIGILIFLGWPITIIYYCCDCCCCYKVGSCKIPLFIITCILYIFSISLCIYGGIKSNSIIMGITDTKCSILKFFYQILEGEEKQTLPKWPGFNHISDILIDIKDEIKDLRNITLNNLNQELNNIENKKIIFKNKMEESGNSFFSPLNSSKYIDLYCSDEYNINSRGITGKYVLDLVKIFGRRADIDEEKYEPKNSILDNWHNEYKLISKNADTYLEKTLNDLTILSDYNVKDIVESLEQGIENINILKDFFNNTNIDIEDILINESDLLDKLRIKSFKIFFLFTGLINFIIPLLIFVVCICSEKNCDDCDCIIFTFKYLVHLLWNVLYLIIIIAFILGIILTFVGTLGNDIVSIVSFIISEENFGVEGENLIIDQLGDAKNYLNICINGNGRIYDLLNINSNKINSLNKLLKNEDQINKIKNEFKEKKNFKTYSYYVNQLEERANLEIIPLLIKDSYDINLPLNGDQYYGNQPDKYLKFDIELEYLNNLIRSQETGANQNEQWIINSYSPNECGSKDDPIYYFSEFNPLKCKPINRDWIQTTSNNDIKAEAKIISDILSFLNNANNKIENIYNSENPSFINILNNLKRVYNEYLDQYIISLESFNNTLNKITGKLRQYINYDDNIFSFMNGKIIGINLKIMLKYLKKSLGKDAKNLGICFNILGIFLAVSVYCTVLFIKMLNFELKIAYRREVGYFNTFIINKLTAMYDVNHLPIGTMDRMTPKRSYANEYIKEAYNLLIKGCKIDPNILDKRGNCQSGWRTGCKNGPKGYLKDYHPPIGWTGIGLKVASMYDNGNNVWLGNDNCNGEWYIGYHGVKSIEAIHGICIDGFRRGDGQAYENSVNINPLTNKKFPKCEEGVYFTNEIKEAKKYTKLIKYNGNKYRIVFMCRVNPYKVRIAKVKGGGEYWIVKGDKLGDLRGIKRSDEVRPYRILMLKEKNN